MNSLGVSILEDKIVDDEHDNSLEDDDLEVGVEDNDEESDPKFDDNFDGLADIWKEMSDGLESSRDIASSSHEHVKEEKEQCDHSLILEDDIGYVCRVCGIIERSIESIIEYQLPKETASVEAAEYM
ncbi:Helicase, C-terminal [Artemisia annua]|uniref:Helicase, C-terminal n=1 Tax=Artemisia annua TaxID=35608 RepID=A0A2U1L5P3_ARTAN|nr:Helicase, C-terminal [Artemisia annua]